MTEQERNEPLDQQATIQRLEVLAHDQQHVRISALRMAGSLLQASEQGVVKQLVNELDEEIVKEGGALYTAYEQLYVAIAKEVGRLGRELQEQATLQP
jgi:hypothetical protein